ncbi:MAG: glycosyltransferase family A protein [Verrucomicrobiota bacterium]|nr:glycosyltransferase family A protein [Verrucomicrobiota bacterium]
MKVSVVIPTFNGGKNLISCISSVLAQKVGCPFEIVIIDSESNDGSIIEIKRMLKESHISHKIISIKQKDFKHGHSRNKAIQNCTGEIIALLTQDAIPVNNTWLSNLIFPFETDSKIAGVFGRHEAYKSHSVLLKRDIKNHFLKMEDLTIREIFDSGEYNENEKIRQKLHFFSNNNSAIKKSVWASNPFPDVLFGEDQTWAKIVLEKGFKTSYQKDSVVYHSHDYGLMETFERTSIEVRFFKKYFDYDLSVSIPRFCLSVSKSVITDIRWLLENHEFSLFELTYSIKVNLGSNLARLACRVNKVKT